MEQRVSDDEFVGRYVCSSRIPLVLHLAVPYRPINPDHVRWSVPTRALTSPKMMSVSDFGTAAVSASSCS